MSIFDKRAGFDPGPWLREKSLACLREVAKLVDLANEPDTTPWYSRRLRSAASRLVDRLAPITLLVHNAERSAVAEPEWSAITEHGTFALAAWCERWGIAEAKFLGLSGADDILDDGKNEAPVDHPQVDPNLTRALDHRLELMGLLTRRMLNEELPDGARRLLLFLMGQLRYSAHSDVVLVSKRFLPVDIGVEADGAAVAYRVLYEQGFVERVDTLTHGTPDGLALRLVVESFNDRKHSAAYHEETFGFPGADIDGKPTIGNILSLSISQVTQRMLQGWPTLTKEDYASLRGWLQDAISERHVFIEEARVSPHDEDIPVEVSVRMTSGESDDAVRAILSVAAEAWLRQHLAGLRGDISSAS